MRKILLGLVFAVVLFSCEKQEVFIESQNYTTDTFVVVKVDYNKAYIMYDFELKLVIGGENLLIDESVFVKIKDNSVFLLHVEKYY